ncbi:MAG: hypothetical protein MJ109_01865 [Kiritimatiellae bacterium]|nr:hypothetical protein [Kiritimatiellia bacterium]
MIEWYVKTDDGKVYGPAEPPKLIRWAQEGRIEPTSLLSRDRLKWTPAPLMKELEMKWIVETELGRLFGPFNHGVVSKLIEQKVVPPTARIYRLYDGTQEGGAIVLRGAYRKMPEAVSPTKTGNRPGLFDKTDPRKLAALEAALKNEMARAKRMGVTVNFK